MLKDKFKLQKSASLEFFSEISLLHIWSFIDEYENEMTAACEKLICCCCDEFFDECIYQIDDLNDFIHLHRFNLNLYDYNENSWVFCCLCYDSVKYNSISKFFSKNLINVTTCQNYLSVLKDLIIVKEYLIIKYHSINIIFKLWSDSHFSSVNYNTLQKHMIIIFQDSDNFALFHSAQSFLSQSHNQQYHDRELIWKIYFIWDCWQHYLSWEF